MASTSTRTAVSVIICTRDRSADLRHTLQAFRKVSVPEDWKVELLVVDNGSSDDTPAVVKAFAHPQIETRYLSEPRQGHGHALNTGIASAQGEILLFTDDDVRPAVDWLEQLALPLFRRQCDAVCGRITLAPHLLRPWMSDGDKRWLASCETPASDPPELIGANMGIHRSVLQKVPAIDTCLGPGGLGLGGDTLFSLQLVQAGLRVRFVSSAVIVHYPNPQRLLRYSWLKIAESHGRKDAYLLHHWHHQSISTPLFKELWVRFKLHLRRLVHPPASLTSEGCTPWEMGYVGDIEMYRFYRAIRTHKRNYSRLGLRRVTYLPPLQSTAGAGRTARGCS